MKFNLVIQYEAGILAVAASCGLALMLHGCGSSSFAGKSAQSHDSSNNQSSNASGALIEGSPKSSGPVGSTSQVKSDASTNLGGQGSSFPFAQCRQYYQQVGELSCTGFNPSVGVPNGIRRMDLRGKQITGSIDTSSPSTPIGAGGTTSAALVLTFIDVQGSVAYYKISGSVSWGIYAMGTGKFDLECLQDGTLSVVEHEAAPGLDRTCSYKMSPASTQPL